MGKRKIESNIEKVTFEFTGDEEKFEKFLGELIKEDLNNTNVA